MRQSLINKFYNIEIVDDNVQHVLGMLYVRPQIIIRFTNEWKILIESKR